MLTITYNGKPVADVPDGRSWLAVLQGIQGQSAHHALRHGGYAVVDADGNEPANVAEYRQS